jgi:hypothetical protein
MKQDKLDLLGPLMNDLGQELADIVGGDPDGVFLYVEVGEGWVEPSVFKDEGDVIRYYSPRGTDLSNILRKAWYLEPDQPNMRWSVLEYDVKDGQFAVTLKYPEEVNVEVMDEERREAALRARYGDKPVFYPPLSEAAFELKP